MKLRALTVALALSLSPALGQTFESGSNGTDGALAFPPNAGTIDFNPDSFDRRLDPERDHVYHFTTITIPVGTTVRLSARILSEGQPVVWLASGAVTISGTLDLNGESGHAAGATAVSAFAGAGGFGGGVGGSLGVSPTPGNGPGAGGAGTIVSGGDNWGSGGPAGHLRSGTATFFPSSPPLPFGGSYGNQFLRPLFGGSGGGGGAARPGDPPGGGGGAGGGAVLIASSVSIKLNGVVRAQGGNGSTGGPGAGGPGSGGGGSGGGVRLMAPMIEGSGSINVAGGTAHQPHRGDLIGSPGRVRLEALRFPSLPAIVPPEAGTRAAPGSVFLPATAPLVRIVRVAGVAVALNPTGSFTMPDVVINAGGTVPIDIETRSIPVGTVLSLTLQPENAAALTVSSTPLVAGTGDVATATAQALFQAGHTRVFAQASWTP